MKCTGKKISKREWYAIGGLAVVGLYRKQSKRGVWSYWDAR